MAELSASGSFDDGHYNLDCADGLIDYFRDISDVFKENSEYLLSERRPSLDSLKWLVGVMLGYRSALQEKAPLIMQPPPPLKAFLQGQAKLMELWHRAFWSLDELVQLTEELYSLQLQQPM